jgi:hypothetical protein
VLIHWGTELDFRSRSGTVLLMRDNCGLTRQISGINSVTYLRQSTNVHDLGCVRLLDGQRRRLTDQLVLLEIGSLHCAIGI